MARIFSEGFEVYNSSDWTQTYTMNWTNWVAQAPSITSGRTGGRGSASLTETLPSNTQFNPYFRKTFGSNYSELYFRLYFKMSGNNGTSTNVLAIEDSAGTLILAVKVLFSTTWQMSAARTGSSDTRIEPAGWVGSNWTLLEAYAKAVSGTTIFTVKVDGAQVFTNTWAATTGAGNINRFYTQLTGRGTTSSWDDIAVNDTSGSVNNSWVGNGSIVALLPTSDSSVGWTGSDSDQTNNYQHVDERSTDSDTTYIRATAAATDVYECENLSALASGESVNCVFTAFRARKEAATAASVRAGIDSGGTTSWDTTRSPTTSYTGYQSAAWDTDPNTSAAWTESAVNALKLKVDYV